MLESKVFEIIEKEKHRQGTTCELIASENFVSENVMRAVGSCLTNKYSEGYPAMRTSGNKGRYYGGCQYVDELEEYCCDKWREAFNTDYHVNVQPHSGSQANMAAYFSVLKPGDTILAMSLDNGGHLTHGSGVNFSGKLFNTVFYNVYRKTTSSSYGDISYNSRAGHARIYARGDHVSPSNRQRSMKRESSDFNHGECQNPQMGSGKPYEGLSGKQRNDCGNSSVRTPIKQVVSKNTGTRYPRSIQKFTLDKDKFHPTQKPVALLEYLIKTYTDEGMTVLDNCMGSGSTGVACVNTNRKFIGIELEEEYFSIASNRIAEAMQAKSQEIA